MDDKTLSDFMPKTNSEGEIIIGEFSQQSSIKLTTDEVIKKLSTVKDPELGINIYDLGLIYDIKIDEGNNVNITMTLTTVNCPVADSFPLDIAKNITSLENTGQVKVKLTFDPPWNKDMMSDDARLANLASSLIISLFHGGSNVSLTLTCPVFSKDVIFLAISSGKESATGQLTVVRVMVIFTLLPSSILIS